MAGLEFARYGDAFIEHAKIALHREVAAARHDLAAARDEAAKAIQAGRSQYVAICGDGSAQVDFAEAVFSVFNAQPVAVPFNRNLRTIG